MTKSMTFARSNCAESAVEGILKSISSKYACSEFSPVRIHMTSSDLRGHKRRIL